MRRERKRYFDGCLAIETAQIITRLTATKSSILMRERGGEEGRRGGGEEEMREGEGKEEETRAKRERVYLM